MATDLCLRVLWSTLCRTGTGIVNLPMNRTWDDERPSDDWSSWCMLGHYNYTRHYRTSWGTTPSFVISFSAWLTKLASLWELDDLTELQHHMPCSVEHCRQWSQWCNSSRVTTKVSTEPCITCHVSLTLYSISSKLKGVFHTTAWSPIITKRNEQRSCGPYKAMHTCTWPPTVTHHRLV